MINLWLFMVSGFWIYTVYTPIWLIIKIKYIMEMALPLLMVYKIQSDSTYFNRGIKGF